MKHIHLIRQHDEKDCGAACVSMILQAYGKKLPLAAVREAIKVDEYGASIYGLQDGAKQFGMDAEAFRGSAEDVWDCVRDEPEQLPAVVRILNRGGFEHYVVVRGIAGGRMKLCDPDAGRVSLSREQFRACFLGEIITFAPSADFRKENGRRGQLRRFTDMLLRQKKLLAVIGVLSLLVTGIGMAGAFVFQYIVDSGLSGLSADGKETALNSLAVMLGGVAVLYIFRFGAQMLRSRLLGLMSRNIDLPLMLGYYNHVADLPVEFFETRKTGEIMSRFSDASKIRDALSGAALTIMIDVAMVAVCGVVLYRQSPVLFAIAAGIFLAYILVTALYIKPLDKVNRESMEKSAVFNSYLKESIDGMETVKAFQAEDGTKEKAGRLFRDNLDRGLKAAMLSLGKDTIIETIEAVGTLAILWAGVVSIAGGSMTAGTLIAFYALTSYFLSPVENLVGLQGTIQTAVAAADRLNDVLNLKPEDKNGIVPEGDLETVSAEHVDFRYGNRSRVLHDLSFRLKKGEQIALVGESGCGKSTATKLLMGMYSPEAGQVMINGIPMNELSLEWLRKHTAYVPQNTFLFSGSIRENLLLGIPADEIPADEEIEKVLKACCCEFVAAMPFGVDSMLEENAANLSGGQRQRLAIARAILRKPQLLIMDEATSALDTVTEYRIQKAFRELLPDAAIIIVAHRLSTVHRCSRIYVMDAGHVAENGTHTELLQLGGNYAELWNRQNMCA